MSVSDMFRDFLSNIQVEKSDQFKQRYGEITKALNMKFRDTDSTIDNSLQVGSYGRYTGIKGISDLDMIYIMPSSNWDDYKDQKQSKLLADVRDAIKARYPSTNVKVDGLVVSVKYQNFHVEVQPVFNRYNNNQDESGYYEFPHTGGEGSWKKTKPRQEMKAVHDLNLQKNKNLRLLCKMIRAWRNKHGVAMGGLLIDTLAFNFLKSTTEYDDKGYHYFDWLSRDYFKYISELPDQDHYKAPGSNQNVKVKKKFQKKANEAYELCLAAIEAEGKSSVNDKWKKVYGHNFPSGKALKESLESASTSWEDTEEFIEEQYSVDIRYNISIDCEVRQDGFLMHKLSYMLLKHIPLLSNKELLFKVTAYDIPDNFTLKWKVLNRGQVAKNKNQIRGQIIDDQGYRERKESTSFQGEHFVECYAIQDDVVVARASIDVPIQQR